jgi:hypothetical protein
MTPPKWSTTVTPLSKTIALIIFTSFPFLGFFLGILYQKLQPATIQYLPETKLIKIYPTDSPRDLVIRCGDLPDDQQLGIYSDHYTRVFGPFWSANCRYLAWSSWQSGAMGLPYNGPYKYEGLFIYDYAKKSAMRVYIPKNDTNQETVELKYWHDSTSIVFTKDGQGKLFIYDLVTKKISEN